jgi:hypothetical protein
LKGVREGRPEKTTRVSRLEKGGKRTENALIDRFEVRDVSLSEKRLREELC